MTAMDTDTALRLSERRLRTLVEGIPQLVWTAVDGGHWTWASPQWTRYTGQSDVDSHGLGWLDPVHPDDREHVRQIWASAIKNEAFEAEYRILHVGEGRYRWFQTRAAPVRDADGSVIEWLGTSTDVDDLRRLQSHQQILVAELQHRVRNILTVVRSVFNRTFDNGPGDDRIDHFRGRLDSLARTQVSLSRQGAGAIDLEEMIRDELLSIGVQDGPGLIIDGPDVALPAPAAEAIGLALHELATNALKYGAFGVEGARLEVCWRSNIGDGGRRTLTLTWTEQGVPAVAVSPSRFGFGREFIERALPYRLEAETALEFRGGGIRCSIAFPLPDGEAADARGAEK